MLNFKNRSSKLKKQQITQSDKIKIIAPNLKLRISGVTSTIIRLLPIQGKTQLIFGAGFNLPDTIPQISLLVIPFLSRQKPIIWHARRNNEMILGLIYKYVFFCKLVLIFTSAAQRNHSKLTQFLISNMDHLIATSEKSARFLKYPSNIIMHGIDTNSFFPTEDNTKLREQLNLPNSILVGCFGRMRPEKGIDLIIDAAIELLKKNYDITVVFTGRVTPKFQYFMSIQQKKIEELNFSKNFLFLGEQSWSNITKTYQALDLFVAPARQEGFGLTPLEAMSSGIPVIASENVGAFNEQIIVNKTGLLFEAGNSTDLTNKLEVLINKKKLRQKMGLVGREHILKKFSIDKEAQLINSLYQLKQTAH